MRNAQQDVARRELAALDEALGRPGRSGEDAPSEGVQWPGWLPQTHSHAQYREYQRRMQLWEAQEARSAGQVQESAATLTDAAGPE